MEDVEGDELADVAYGLFEILLNSELQSRGNYLFKLVEETEDFKADFDEIFHLFETEYPLLAESLISRFEDRDAIYAMIQNGEGVIPTSTTQMYWIIQDSPSFHPEDADDEKMGKWLIFLEEDAADEMWKKIRDATSEGRLGISAKVSTKKPNPESRDERVVIYVYSSNWEDEEDVMRIREELRDLGIDQRIGYKRNIETYMGEYSEKGKKVTFYSA
jgi:hypothetical protein